MKITTIQISLVLLLFSSCSAYAQHKKEIRISKADSLLYLKAAARGADVKPSLLSRYRKISATLKHKVAPSEELVHAIGMTYLAADKSKMALALFELNQTNYPASYKVYDTLGDYYTATGHIPEAIEAYKKAIRLNYNSDSVEKLKNLQGDREHL